MYIFQVAKQKHNSWILMLMRRFSLLLILNWLVLVSQVAFVRCLMAISGTIGVGVSNLNVRELTAYVGHGPVVKP